MKTPYQIITLAFVADIIICYGVKTYSAGGVPDCSGHVTTIILMVTVMYQLLRLYILSRKIIS